MSARTLTKKRGAALHCRVATRSAGEQEAPGHDDHQRHDDRNRGEPRPEHKGRAATRPPGGRPAARRPRRPAPPARPGAAIPATGTKANGAAAPTAAASATARRRLGPRRRQHRRDAPQRRQHHEHRADRQQHGKPAPPPPRIGPERPHPDGRRRREAEPRPGPAPRRSPGRPASSRGHRLGTGPAARSRSGTNRAHRRVGRRADEPLPHHSRCRRGPGPCGPAARPSRRARHRAAPPGRTPPPPRAGRRGVARRAPAPPGSPRRTRCRPRRSPREAPAARSGSRSPGRAPAPPGRAGVQANGSSALRDLRAPDEHRRASDRRGHRAHAQDSHARVRSYQQRRLAPLSASANLPYLMKVAACATATLRSASVSDRILASRRSWNSLRRCVFSR